MWTIFLKPQRNKTFKRIFVLIPLPPFPPGPERIQEILDDGRVFKPSHNNFKPQGILIPIPLLLVQYFS